MAEPEQAPVESGETIEVSFPLDRAVRIVREIDLIPRFMLHEGKKQIRDVFLLRDTLAAQLIVTTAEKGTAS